MKLTSDTATIGNLSSHEQDQMFALMQSCYENTCRENFDRDLAAKQWVLRVFDFSTTGMVGFSTQVMLGLDIDGQHVNALFSGDTVVHPSYWGAPALANAWGKFALELIDEKKSSSLYWFLTSKGFRTYRYLPLFFRHYTPSIDKESTDFEVKVIDALGSMIAPQSFNPNSRVIQASESKEWVRPDLASPHDRANHDPHVRYFLNANPGYAHGDELCCLAPLRRDNFTRTAWRVINMHSDTNQPVHR